MAARLNPKQDERARSAIQTSQLINRLQDFAFEKDGVSIDPQRMKAIEILLRKSLPDLQSVTLETGPAGFTVNIDRSKANVL